jgi:hypothetical protein
MRLATGCHKATPISHLYAECKMMLVLERLSMLCSQFLANCLRPTHPSNSIVLLPPGPRKNAKNCPMKETLSSRFLATVDLHLRGGIVPTGLYNKIEDEIHTAAVRNFLASASPNEVLGVKPPEIDPSEQSLPRAYRTVLSQLRGDKCSTLRSYMHYIKATDDDTCPNCQSAPHTPLHLFSCSAMPTVLTFWDLWRHPVVVAVFLESHPSFNHLPPLPPRRPRPPPEPPP